MAPQPKSDPITSMLTTIAPVASAGSTTPAANAAARPTSDPSQTRRFPKRRARASQTGIVTSIAVSAPPMKRPVSPVRPATYWM